MKLRQLSTALLRMLYHTFPMLTRMLHVQAATARHAHPLDALLGKGLCATHVTCTRGDVEA